METLITYPENKEQAAALKAVLKALKIPFKTAPKDTGANNPEFVAKIKKSEEDFKAGRAHKTTLDDIWK